MIKKHPLLKRKFLKLDLVGLLDNNSKNYITVVEYLRKCHTTSVVEPLDPEVSDPLLYADSTVKAFKQKHKTLSDREVKAVIQKYGDGATTYELAKEFGCHRVTISAVLKQNGIRLRDSSEYPRRQYC